MKVSKGKQMYFSYCQMLGLITEVLDIKLLTETLMQICKEKVMVYTFQRVILYPEL